jgi:hypothetical protein
MTTNGYGPLFRPDGRVFPWCFRWHDLWDQAAAMIAYLTQKVGGQANSRQRRSCCHDRPTARSIPVFDALRHATA